MLSINVRDSQGVRVIELHESSTIRDLKKDIGLNGVSLIFKGENLEELYSDETLIQETTLHDQCEIIAAQKNYNSLLSEGETLIIHQSRDPETQYFIHGPTNFSIRDILQSFRLYSFDILPSMLIEDVFLDDYKIEKRSGRFDTESTQDLGNRKVPELSPIEIVDQISCDLFCHDRVLPEISLCIAKTRDHRELFSEIKHLVD